MTPASQGGRVNPTIGCSRRKFVAGQGAPRISRWQHWPSKIASLLSLPRNGLRLRLLRDHCSGRNPFRRTDSGGCPSAQLRTQTFQGRGQNSTLEPSL